MSEEVQVEEKTEEKQSVELSEDLQAFIEKIENLSVIELATLVKALEEKFGVSASAAVAVAAPAAGGGAGDAGAAEAKDSFDVILAAAGDKKIQVIKEVRAITSLGLKEAKELVDNCPKPLKEGASKEDADKIKEQIEAAGGTVELK